MEHILANPAAEVAWWLSGTAEQFRFSGRAFAIPAPEHPLHATFMEKLSDSPALTAVGAKGAKGDEEAEIGVHTRSDGYRPLAVDSVRCDAAQCAPSLYSRRTPTCAEWLHTFWSRGTK